MPEHPFPKSRPRTGPPPDDPPPRARRAASPFAELHALTNFTFLRGASHPDEMVRRAAELGHAAAAVTDVNSLAGIVRAHAAAKEAGIPLAVGCRLELAPLPGRPPLRLLAFAPGRSAYAALCTLLTLGKRRAPKGHCHLTLHDLLDAHPGLLCIALPPPRPHATDDAYAHELTLLRDTFGPDHLFLAAPAFHRPAKDQHLRRIQQLADHLRLRTVATNLARYHDPARRALHDVLACVRLGCTLDDAGLRLAPSADRHLRHPEDMARLVEHICPGSCARAAEIALRAAQFSLDQLRYEYPDEAVPPGQTPHEHLRTLTFRGAAERYPRGVPEKVRAQIEHELTLIHDLNYAPYFITVHDIVRFARSRGILCQGRGAAANSAVCYCLGVTAVDPDRIDVLFERFISRERDEPPDIDIDFEHQRREEVIQHIYQTYGRDRAALTAEVITYRGRSAVRDVGKALGLSLDAVDRLAKSLDWWERGALRKERVRELGLDPEEPTLAMTLDLTAELLGFPRHLSQHVGGFVITRGPLSELVPIENAAMEDRTVIEWDKDDIDLMGMLKVDILGLGMLTCVAKCLHAVGGDDLPLSRIPPEDPAVYDMICRADTIGVFQIESRAQMSMLPRLKPKSYYDLVIEVAIVRPGPIVGDMVHPYLRRRDGIEPVNHPDDTVRRILGKTLGVPLFQEQAMQLAIDCAGFTPGEADRLRRAIAAWKTRQNVIHAFGEKIIQGMTSRGYERDFAQRCFEQLKGFSEYGFPESHAASFALIVYASAWLKRRHPAAFAAALLNSQPMGFYAPAQIVRDARDHGVPVLPIDANLSRWDCTLEDPLHPGRPLAEHYIKAGRFHDAPDDAPPQQWGARGPALRLGLRLIRGLQAEQAQRIAHALAAQGHFRTIAALRRAAGLRVATLRLLAAADAFRSMNLDRQQALWMVRALRDEPMPLFDHLDHHHPHDDAEPHTPGPTEGALALPPHGRLDRILHDYHAAGLCLHDHPVAVVRPALEQLGAVPCDELRDESRSPAGRRTAVAGIVLVRQRPSTASGVVFMTIEDETGPANLIIRPKIYEKYRRAARHSAIILARGRIERKGEVVHLLVRSIHDVGQTLQNLDTRSRDFR